MGQEVGQTAVGHRPQSRECGDEHRLLRRDPPIRCKGERQAPAGGDPREGGDDRLGHADDLADHELLLPRQFVKESGEVAARPGLLHGRHISAGGERPSLARKDHRADLMVEGHLLERRAKLTEGRDVHGVQPLGARDPNLGNCPAALDTNTRAHGRGTPRQSGVYS